MASKAELERRIAKALEELFDAGAVDGGHYKQYGIDQTVRILTGGKRDPKTLEYTKTSEYLGWMIAFKETGIYWDEGVAP